MKKQKPNNVTDSVCLLTYLPSSYPAPLQVSTPQTPAIGLLHTAAINKDTKPVRRAGTDDANQVLTPVPITFPTLDEAQENRTIKERGF